MHATPEPLYTAAKELTDLYPRLVQLVHEESTVLKDADMPHRHALAYLEPWNTPAGQLAHDIHTQIRRYETALSNRLFGKATYRGTSNALTIAAFNRLAILIDTAHTRGLDNTDIDEAETLLMSWPRRIRLLLDEPKPGEEPWTKAPGDLRCPQCERRLYLQPGWRDHPERADAVCTHCRDEDGRMLSWPAETWTLVLQQPA